MWDLQSDPQSTHPGLTAQPQQVAEFLGHKYGVNCVVSSIIKKKIKMEQVLLSNLLFRRFHLLENM